MSVSASVQASEIPERLANNTWNCSVPHWPRFQNHFRCNLRQECVSREDEVQCPYSPCNHGGVIFAGHCYFYLTSNASISWNEAQPECRKVGAYMASLTTPREWSDVSSWLRLETRWQETEMYLGLASTSPSVPFM